LSFQDTFQGRIAPLSDSLNKPQETVVQLFPLQQAVQQPEKENDICGYVFNKLEAIIVYSLD
jgi:hypothetical protein